MRTWGNLPSFEDIESGKMVVCDANYGWLRERRKSDKHFLGIANGNIRAGYSASFVIFDPDDIDDCKITESGKSNYSRFLPEFREYIDNLGECYD